MCEVIWNDRQTKTVCENVLYGRSCNFVASLIRRLLLKSDSSDFLKGVIMCVKSIVLEYEFFFTEEIEENIYSRAYDRNFSASSKCGYKHLSNILWRRRCSSALWCWSFSTMLSYTYLQFLIFDDRALDTSKYSCMFLLLRVSKTYIANLDKLRGKFPLHSFYRVNSKFVSPLRAHFLEIQTTDCSQFAFYGFGSFHGYIWILS